MSSRLVDGVTLPLPVAGHPALDFCNSRAGWGAHQPKEYLLDPAVLVIWCREAALITDPDARQLLASAASHPQEARDVLRRALELREAIYRTSLGVSATTSDWELISAEARLARGASTLRPGIDRGPARWQFTPTGSAALPVLAIAASAADLLTGPLAGTVGACPGAGCGWLFSDPRGRRRWCSMAVCGNRAKARRHREIP
jgi:predicted RNA-binding Zn ribbon-like protein